MYITDLTNDQALALALILKTYFPELGTEAPMNGSEVLNELNELYSSLPQIEETQS